MRLVDSHLSNLLSPLTAGECVLLVQGGNGQPTGSLLCLNRSKLIMLAVRERIPLAWLRQNAALLHGLLLWEIQVYGGTFNDLKLALERKERI